MVPNLGAPPTSFDAT